MQTAPTPLPKDSSTARDQKFRQGVFDSLELCASTKLWPIATAPEGWITCAGAAISRTVYADLFKVIGTTFGVGDGTTTFNVPNVNASAPSGFIYIIKV